MGRTSALLLLGTTCFAAVLWALKLYGKPLAVCVLFVISIVTYYLCGLWLLDLGHEDDNSLLRRSPALNFVRVLLMVPFLFVREVWVLICEVRGSSDTQL